MNDSREAEQISGQAKPQNTNSQTDERAEAVSDVGGFSKPIKEGDSFDGLTIRRQLGSIRTSGGVVRRYEVRCIFGSSHTATEFSLLNRVNTICDCMPENVESENSYKQQRDDLSEEMERCHRMLDVYYGESLETTSVDTLEERLERLLAEIRQNRTPAK